MCFLHPDQTPSHWSDTRSGRHTGASGPVGLIKTHLRCRLQGTIEYKVGKLSHLSSRCSRMSRCYFYSSPEGSSSFVFIILVGGWVEKSILFPESGQRRRLRVVITFLHVSLYTDATKSYKRDLLVKYFILFCCSVILFLKKLNSLHSTLQSRRRSTHNTLNPLDL